MDESDFVDYDDLTDQEKVDVLIDQSQVLYEFAALVADLDKKFNVVKYLQSLDRDDDIDLVGLAYEATEFHDRAIEENKERLH